MLTSFFHGNGLSVSADRISVLVATCSFARAEHIHVLNRRNYCNIPEIESPSGSLAIIFSGHKKHGCPHERRQQRSRDDGLSVRAGVGGYAAGTVTGRNKSKKSRADTERCKGPELQREKEVEARRGPSASAAGHFKMCQRAPGQRAPGQRDNRHAALQP